MPGDIDNILETQKKQSRSPAAPFTTGGMETEEGASLSETLAKYRTQLKAAWQNQNPSVDDDKEEIIRKSRALFINLVPDIAEGTAFLINCAESEAVRLQAMKFVWEIVNGDQGKGGPMDPLNVLLQQLKGIPETAEIDGPPQGAQHIIDMDLTSKEKGKVAKVTMSELEKRKKDDAGNSRDSS
jgi:hypothetical protein